MFYNIDWVCCLNYRLASLWADVKEFTMLELANPDYDITRFIFQVIKDNRQLVNSVIARTTRV